MDVAETLEGLLENTKLTDLCSPRQSVVVLEHNMTIGEALKMLAKNKILSAPLVAGYDLEDIAVGAVDGEPLSPTLLGWVDINDILRAFIRQLQEKHKPIPSKMLQLMGILEAEGPPFAQKMLVTITGGHDRGLVYQVNNNNTLLDAIRDVFLKPSEEGSTVVHRLAVFDSHGSVINVISQTDVIRLFHSKLPTLGDIGQRSIYELGLLTGKPPVLSVSPYQPTLLAYQTMLEAGVQAAAVVAESGELIANLSVSDLRCIQMDHFGVLALPVGEFLAVLHGTVYVGYSVRTSGSAQHPFFASGSKCNHGGDNDLRLITCTKDTVLGQLLDTFVSHHVHRVYIVDSMEHPKPLAVITLTDVLRMMAGL